MKPYKRTKAIRYKNRRGRLGKHHSKETILMMSELRKGNPKFCGKNHPMYGRHHSKKTKELMKKLRLGKKHSEETKLKLSMTNSGKNHPMYGRRGKKSPWYGRRHTKRTKLLISLKNKGTNNWLGKKHTTETKNKMRIARKRHWKNLNKIQRNRRIKNILLASRIFPNKSEIIITKLLNKICNNQYSYVGNGGRILGGFCPDFIDIKNKRVIELNGYHWHSKQGDIKKDKRKYATYKKLGYKALIIWDYELKNIDNVSIKIINFNGDNT